VLLRRRKIKCVDKASKLEIGLNWLIYYGLVIHYHLRQKKYWNQGKMAQETLESQKCFLKEKLFLLEFFSSLELCNVSKNCSELSNNSSHLLKLSYFRHQAMSRGYVGLYSDWAIIIKHKLNKSIIRFVIRR